MTTINENSCFARNGLLHVDGKYLVNAKGDKVELHGISTHNIGIYPEYINEEAFTQFANEYKVNVMRLAMYTAYADEVQGYSDCQEEHRKELEELILKGVELCAKVGIYCLVDWHILFDYNPNMHVDSAIRFWENMCPKLKKYDNVIYEICNEPNMDTVNNIMCSWQEIKDFASKVIPVIRNIDPDKVIVVGTPLWSQLVDEAADAPLDYDNLMYTLHFYADTHKEDLREKLRYALSKDLPVFVTEFGVCNAQGDGDVNAKETDTWLTLLKENHISYIIWNLSNKNETSSLIKADCSKISGFTDDDLSNSGLYMKKYM